MKKTIGLLIVLGLAAIPASAQKVTIDYAKDFNFKATETLPEKQAQQIDKILAKLGDKWDKILAGQGK